MSQEWTAWLHANGWGNPPRALGPAIPREDLMRAMAARRERESLALELGLADAARHGAGMVRQTSMGTGHVPFDGFRKGSGR